MSEEEFLKSTPKKLFKLAEIHNRVNAPDTDEKGNKKQEEVYIDNLVI